MPTRRALLQSLAGIPFAPLLTINGVTKSAMVAIPPGKYLMFADTNSIDFDIFEKPHPFTEPLNFEMEIIPVFLRNGQTIDDAVRIYRLDEK